MDIVILYARNHRNLILPLVYSLPFSIVYFSRPSQRIRIVVASSVRQHGTQCIQLASDM